MLYETLFDWNKPPPASALNTFLVLCTLLYDGVIFEVFCVYVRFDHMAVAMKVTVF